MTKFVALLSALLMLQAPLAAADWFDDLKAVGSPEELYRTLYYMPKGGDLHNHLSGAVYPEWWYDLALAQSSRGFQYYTKVRIDNCVDYGNDEFGGSAYFLLFRNLSAHRYAALGECEQGEYKRLQDLNDNEKTAWLNSISLDKSHEGREEFFQTHWQRLDSLLRNPWIQAEIMVRNMRAFADEGVSYIEFQVSVNGFRGADGSDISANSAANILRERLRQKDALATGVTTRFQIDMLRFLPNAEQSLRNDYKFVHDNSDVFVGVNMVGREDNDAGHPRRFLSTMRDLRRQYGNVNLSIHAGEVDEPNDHVRDTLLLGADRIGHGLNLISDDDTMLLMRHGPYLVEINLVSNLLLNYVSNYAQHPFPEYLRTGIPVALSTDDRGMWDSNLTDEFYVAVKEFNLSWEEVLQLSRNSLSHAFVSPDTQRQLLARFDREIGRFERDMKKGGAARLDPLPRTGRFICAHYGICNPGSLSVRALQ